MGQAWRQRRSFTGSLTVLMGWGRLATAYCSWGARPLLGGGDGGESAPVTEEVLRSAGGSQVTWVQGAELWLCSFTNSFAVKSSLI